MILLVDDDPILLAAMRDYLRHRGHAVVTGVDGVEAVEAVARQRPRHLVMDIDMPRMNGIDALDQILSHHANLPVVLITGDADRDGLADRIDGERVRLLVKPFRLTELAEHLSEG